MKLSFIFAMIFLGAFVAGCVEENEGDTSDSEIDSEDAVAGEQAAIQKSTEDISPDFKVRFVSTPFGAIQKSARWDLKALKPSEVFGGKFTIPVCWETLESEWHEERVIVQQIINETWNVHAPVVFEGWGKCDPSEVGVGRRAPGINISTLTSEPTKVEDLGKYLDYRPGGMNFNFKDILASDFCELTSVQCLEAYAIHEFGHALGFAHEHVRDDAPRCKYEQQRETFPNLNLTSYDENSVMNYCKANWSGLRLSDCDKLAAAQLYAPQGDFQSCAG